MQLSKFVVNVENEENYMLYSLKTRKYFIYEKKEQKKLQMLIKNLNKGEYTLQDIDCLKQLLHKGILINDNQDEIEELEYLENKVKYQNDELYIMIVVTNSCNFCCEYCIQEHEVKNLTSIAESNILKFIEKNAKTKRKINISWFGGEPLLRFNDIQRILNKIIKYSEKYDCEILSDFTTNGYLLNTGMIQEMRRLNVQSLQITIDGNRESHDKRRYLVGNGKTYDVVKKNLIEAVKNELMVILRINIDKDNVLNSTEILNEIPQEYREKIVISVANLYQVKDKISAFGIYKRAIELGYQYAERKNQYIACHTCFAQGYIIDMDANIILCTNASEDRLIGKINDNGDIHITNFSTFSKLKTASMTKNPECQKCVELPLCISTCKKSIYKENTKCHGKRANGLSVEEIAKLDYLFDKRKSTGRKI